MTDPIFLIAVSGLGLSVIVSGIRLGQLVSPKRSKNYCAGGAIVGRRSFRAVVAAFVGTGGKPEMGRNHRPVGRYAARFYALRPAHFGTDPSTSPRSGFWFAGPRAHWTRATPSWSSVRSRCWIRRNAGISAYANLRGGRSQISHARSRGNGNGDDAENRDRGFHDGEPDARSMSEAEALEVLGLDPGATEAEIAESHRRLMQLIHPDRGGSPYFAVKANQAKEVLLGRGKPQNGRSTSAGPRKRRRSLGGGLRQGVFARTRDRVFARRALPLHDEQPARKQLLSL